MLSIENTTLVPVVETVMPLFILPETELSAITPRIVPPADPSAMTPNRLLSITLRSIDTLAVTPDNGLMTMPPLIVVVVLFAMTLSVT